MMFHPQVVEHARHHGVGQFLEGGGTTVKARIGGKDGGPGEQEEFKIAKVHEVQRRLAGNEDQPPAFLEHDVGRTQEEVVAQTMRDPAEGPHTARDHHHAVEGI